MKSRAIVILAILAFLVTGALWAAENFGAPVIRIPGGKKADVPFPHKEHQDDLKDCAKCHGIFPKEKGVIEKLPVSAVDDAQRRSGPWRMDLCFAISTDRAS